MHVQAQQGVYPSDMIELIGVSEVFAIPCQQEIAFVVWSQRKMQRVAEWILRHQLMPHICFHDLSDGVINLHQTYVVYQQEGLFFIRIFAARQFIENSFTR